MRRILIALALLAPAVAHADEPNARTVYVERRGLVEADAQCRLFTPAIRSALQAGVSQARGSLLREGWSTGRLRELDQAVVAAAQSRACTDARTQTAAAEAREAFAHWLNASAMEFNGWQRTWLARRTVGANGWRLSQAIDAPIAAIFGVRERDNAQRLTLTIAFARGQTGASTARLILRDAGRTGAAEISLPQRVSYGLEAGAPPATAALTIPSTRTIEPIDNRRSQAVFVFPDSAFRALLALDPRESVVLEVRTGRATQRVLVEVGDIAAARAFLAIRP
ncbi:MAG: hypothetical protein AB7O98_07045 [Hyphomonadaceae bacterium]